MDADASGWRAQGEGAKSLLARHCLSKFLTWCFHCSGELFCNFILEATAVVECMPCFSQLFVHSMTFTWPCMLSTWRIKGSSRPFHDPCCRIKGSFRPLHGPRCLVGRWFQVFHFLVMLEGLVFNFVWLNSVCLSSGKIGSFFCFATCHLKCTFGWIELWCNIRCLPFHFECRKNVERFCNWNSFFLR